MNFVNDAVRLKDVCRQERRQGSHRYFICRGAANTARRLRALSCTILRLPMLAVLCGLGSPDSAAPQAAAAPAPQKAAVGKAALEYLDILKTGNAEAAVKRNYKAMVDFLRLAKNVPTALHPKILHESVVPDFIKTLPSDPIGTYLVDVPNAKVLEVRNATFTDYHVSAFTSINCVGAQAFLALDYASWVASPIVEKGRILKKSGLKIDFCNADGALLVIAIDHVPQMDESWLDDRVVACNIRPSEFDCTTSNSAGLGQGYISLGPSRFDGALGQSGGFRGRYSGRSRPMQVGYSDEAGNLEVFDADYTPPASQMQVYDGALFVREPWLSRKWASATYPWFTKAAKARLFHILAAFTSASYRELKPSAVSDMPAVASRRRVESAGQGVSGTAPEVDQANSELPEAPELPPPTLPPTAPLTKFGIRNLTYQPILVYLDDSESPIEVRTTYQGQLRVGSTHTIRVLVGRNTFTARFTVPRVMRDIRVTNGGLDIR